MKPLCDRDLKYEQKLSLADFVRHPGFEVMKLLFDDAFNQTVAQFASLKRDDDRYHDKLEAYQMEMNICKEVCVALVNSILMHSQAAILERANKAAEEVQQPEPEQEQTVLGERFGSIAFKPKNKQDNQ